MWIAYEEARERVKTFPGESKRRERAEREAQAALLKAAAVETEINRRQMDRSTAELAAKTLERRIDRETEDRWHRERTATFERARALARAGQLSQRDWAQAQIDATAPMPPQFREKVRAELAGEKPPKR